ncbi:MAG: hypothetical protein JXB48_21655 [Candidatus Latescibacteria bacterium]|nr:hypothetical protein [Candidatus Latescibacterota bacterium]
MVDKNGNSRLFFYFKEDELHKWLIRVVKGLYFNSNKTLIDEHSIFKVGILSQLKPQLSDTFPMEKGLELRPYFVYGVVKIEDKLNSECWVLIFYDDLIFTVTVEMPVYL